MLDNNFPACSVKDGTLNHKPENLNRSSVEAQDACSDGSMQRTDYGAGTIESLGFRVHGLGFRMLVALKSARCNRLPSKTLIIKRPLHEIGLLLGGQKRRIYPSETPHKKKKEEEEDP